MKVKRYFSITVVLMSLFLPTFLNAQQWAKTYGGPYWDFPRNIDLTSDGGYIVLGESRSFGANGPMFWLLKLDAYGNIMFQKGFDRSGWEYPAIVQQTSDGGYILAGATDVEGNSQDVWIIKLDSYANVEWEKIYGGWHYDVLCSIKQTLDGGYIASGWTRSFSPLQDAWVFKLDSNGNVEWQKRFAHYWQGQYNSFNSVQQTSDGGYILAGSKYRADCNGLWLWVMKLNSIGNVQWEYLYGSGGGPVAYSIQQTTDGGYIVAGVTREFGAGSDDFWVLKLSSTGSIQWQKAYGGGNSETAYSIKQTSDGGYIVAGTTFSFGAGNKDMMVLKLDENGNILWQKTYGGGDEEDEEGVQQTSDGGFILLGRTSSFGVGDADFWVLKLDENGNIGGCSYPIINTPNITVTTTTAPLSTSDYEIYDTTVLDVNTNANIIYSNATRTQQCNSIIVCSMISWWKGEGNANDSVGRNSGVLENGATFETGIVGQGFKFDGNNYVGLWDNPDFDFGYGSFTIDGWIKTNSPTKVQRLLSAGYEGAGAYGLWTFGYGSNPGWGSGIRLNFAVWNGYGYTDFSSNEITILQNVWHHIAVVRSGTSMTFYFDGNAVGTTDIGNISINAWVNYYYGAFIGARRAGGYELIEFADGMIDEIGLYKQALSAEEIFEIYNSGSSGRNCYLNAGLSVIKSGTGTGSITSNPAGINCGSDCTEIFSFGTGVTLTASANYGSSFAGWGGDCSYCAKNLNCLVVMNSYKNCYATFNFKAGEASKEGSPIAALKGSGTSININYTPANCATDHSVFWGQSPISGNLSWTNGVCGLGTSGTASFDPGNPNPNSFFYFVIVGNNGAVEGSYGKNSSSVERPEATGISGCDFPQDLLDTCQ